MIFRADVVCYSEAWDDLLVTWDINPLNSYQFNSLPKDEKLAIKEISDCKSNKARGNRYILKNDYAVILLFDTSGKIAGISGAIPKNAS